VRAYNELSDVRRGRGWERLSFHHFRIVAAWSFGLNIQLNAIAVLSLRLTNLSNRNGPIRGHDLKVFIISARADV
jgi:hypothetical protein